MPSPHHSSMPSPPRRRPPRDAPRMLPRVRKASPKLEPTSSSPDLKRPRSELHRPSPEAAPSSVNRWPLPGTSTVPVSSPAHALSPSTLPHAKSRRLYIGNLPFHAGLTDFALAQFFSALYVAGYGALAPGAPLPVLSFWLHSDGKFGFMELHSEQETINMMQFNGVMLHARPLRVNRPSDYRPEIHNPSAAPLSPAPMNAHAVVDLCHQLAGIVAAPAHLSALAAATPRPPDRSNNNTSASPAVGPESTTAATPPSASASGSASASASGSAPASASAAASASATVHVSGSGRGDGTGTMLPTPVSSRTKPEPQPVQLRSQPFKQRSHSPARRGKSGDAITNRDRTNANEDVKPNISIRSPPVVISLRNLVTDEDLTASSEDFADLIEDVESECGTYGTVREVNIPRSGPHKGTAFVQFADPHGAESAIASLAKRVFDGRKITAVGVLGCRTASEAANRPVPS